MKIVSRSLLVLLLLSAPLVLWSDDYGPVQVELRGQTQTWTETQPVLETTDDAKFQAERYGERFSYVLTGLPPGLARLKMGFCEFKYDQPGQRVFDINVNGKTHFEDFDILRWGEPGEAVTTRTSVTIPENEPLVIEFVGKTENAKFNFLKLYTSDWSFEIKASDEPEVLLSTPSRNSAHMHQAYETCISKFGSRICINPRPQKGVCRQSALGHADYNVAYFENNPTLYKLATTAVYYAVNCRGPQGEDLWYSLPFNGRIPGFSVIKQTQTLTSLTYVCRAPDLPVEVTYAFHAPFYPQDLKLSVAPYIMLDVTVRNLLPREQTGTILVGHAPRPTETARFAEATDSLGVVYDLPVFERNTLHAWLADPAAAEGVEARVGTLAIPAAVTSDDAETTDSDMRTLLQASWADAASGLAWNYALAPRGQDTRSFVYAGWVGEPILEVMNEPYHFKYVDLFSDIYDVAHFAFDNRAENDEKIALFESTVYDADGPDELKEFLAFAFQSWMQNTFYCASEDGEDWFSVWEGCCKFHSTVDVEYNVAPLYFEYWPDLMKLTLRQWVNYIRNGILSHDMGMGLKANGMRYGHDMEVEENTNFVLLLHHYWRQTGDSDLVKELFEHVETLLAHVISCDTDDDGFHERGTYNTIDQGSAAIQYAKDQTYLAVRALCAFECGAEMAKLMDKRDLASQWRRQARLTSRTLESEGWLGDHYAVTLNQPPKQYEAPAQDPWARTQPPSRGMGGGAGPGNWEMEDDGGYQNWNTFPSTQTYKPASGWDSYSIYATNGMLYPMRSGLALPALDLDRMRTDLKTSTLATLQQYGSPHSDHESNMWVSQNIWRDMAAAYLGMDFTDNVERYMNLQKYINRDKRGCFTDVYVYSSDHISLDYYPRGTAAFGLMPAAAGLQVDKVTGKVSVAPVRTPLRIPLLAYADWHAKKVPWLTLTANGEELEVSVNGDLPVQIGTREFGEPW